MIEISKESTEIFKSILGIQNQFLVIFKAASGKNNKYADYTQLISKCKPILTEAGLVLIQPVTYDLSPNGEYQPTVTTMLIHVESGQYIKSVSLVYEMTERKNAKGDAINSLEQRVGGGITYMKRLSLSSMLSWATGDYDLDQGVLDSMNPPKVEITPDKVETWKRAVSAYKRDGNFDAVLKHADISQESQLLIIQEATQ